MALSNTANEQATQEQERAALLRESKRMDKKSLMVDPAKFLRRVDRAAEYKNIVDTGKQAFDKGELSLPKAAQLILRAERLRQRHTREDEMFNADSQGQEASEQGHDETSGGEEEGGEKEKNQREQYHSYTRPLESMARSFQGGREFNLVSRIMLLIAAAVAVFIDILPLITGELSSVFDWIFDIGFYVLIFFVIVIVKQQVVRAIFGVRGVLNMVQTILEVIPVTGALPWHSIAVVILYLDAKYNILHLAKLFTFGARRIGYENVRIKKWKGSPRRTKPAKAA